MVRRRAQLRTRAAEDIDHVVRHLAQTGGEAAAIAFIDALQHGIGQLLRSPALGSLRFAYELGIPDLRALPLRKVPYLVFYVEQNEVIDVWRVLHARRDLPATLALDD